MSEQEEPSFSYSLLQNIYTVWHFFLTASWFWAVAGGVDGAATGSPCPFHEGRWWHLSAGSLSSHTGLPACLWWVDRYVWGPGRHCHRVGRRSSSPPPPPSDSHHPALGTGDSICHSALQMEKRGTIVRKIYLKAISGNFMAVVFSKSGEMTLARI